MRAYQFITEQVLLEYNREITLRNPAFRKKLTDKFLMIDYNRAREEAAHDLIFLREIQLGLNNAQSLMNHLKLMVYNQNVNYLTININDVRYSDIIRKPEFRKLIDDELTSLYIAEYIETYTNHSIRKYIPWILREYANNNIRLLEDVTDAAADLVLYEANKRRRGFPQEAKDIVRLTAQQLHSIVARFNPNDPEGIAYNMGEYDVVYGKLAVTNDLISGAPAVEIASDVVVIHPRDKAASLYFGRVLGGPTEWCTAYIPPRTNQFDYYNRQGPMYIIIPQTPTYEGEKYQVHVNSNQFMNENDDPISVSVLFEKRFPELREIFLKLEPKLSEAVIFADSEVVEKIWKTIGEMAMDTANSMIEDMNRSDDDYYDYIVGFVDENPEYKTEDEGIDWDKVADNSELDYLNYNDSARRFYNDVKYVAELNYKQIMKIYNEKDDDDDSMDSIIAMEKVFAKALESESGRGRDSVSINDIADLITRNVDIRKIKDSEAVQSPTAKRPIWFEMAKVGGYSIMRRI